MATAPRQEGRLIDSTEWARRCRTTDQKPGASIGRRDHTCNMRRRWASSGMVPPIAASEGYSSDHHRSSDAPISRSRNTGAAGRPLRTPRPPPVRLTRASLRSRSSAYRPEGIRRGICSWSQATLLLHRIPAPHVAPAPGAPRRLHVPAGGQTAMTISPGESHLAGPVGASLDSSRGLRHAQEGRSAPGFLARGIAALSAASGCQRVFPRGAGRWGPP